VRIDIARMYAEGLRNGVQGAVADMALFGAIWGVALEQVLVPVQIWVGSADRNVPLDVVVALHEALPGSRLAISEGAGHLWLTDHADVVAAWFASADGEDGVDTSAAQSP
jgi:pimeloyl-ACP methyl ester carboxylesterase